jgi:hypothetical protein
MFGLQCRAQISSRLEVSVLDRVFVMNEAWDHLVVLDACRFDFMERIFTRYIDGELCKRISAGSTTVEWRDSNFPDRYEGVVYVSANPYINSMLPVRGFLGSEHFDRVYDVWSSGWDRSRGTVPPEAVSDAAVLAMKTNPGSRIIAHFLQPHAPYLGIGDDSLGFPLPDLESDKVLAGTASGPESGPRASLLGLLARLCLRMGLLGDNPTWKLRQLLHMAPASPMDAVRRRLGDSGLRAAYQANLEIVLAEVAALLRFMSGRIVVTSDHGELLGEGGRYSHFPGSACAELLEIPWLIVEKGGHEPLETWKTERRESQDAGEDAQAKLKERLRALGYIE